MGSEDGVFYSGDDDDYEETSHHNCARIIHGNGSDMSPDVALEPAVVTHGSGYAARLKVLPTFGCILHEPKEVAP